MFFNRLNDLGLPVYPKHEVLMSSGSQLEIDIANSNTPEVVRKVDASIWQAVATETRNVHPQEVGIHGLLGFLEIADEHFMRIASVDPDALKIVQYSWGLAEKRRIKNRLPQDLFVPRGFMLVAKVTKITDGRSIDFTRSEDAFFGNRLESVFANYRTNTPSGGPVLSDLYPFQCLMRENSPAVLIDIEPKFKIK